MTLPLYDELQAYNKNASPLWDKTSHMGLWFERFYNVYPDVQAIRPKKDMPKAEKDNLIQRESEWLETFQAKQVGETDVLENKTLRQMALAESLQGRMFFASTNWHFVTGMGLSHPIENGMAWHPTLGVPYLTGAAIKGLVRAWLASWDVNPDNEKQKQQLLTWFGSDHKDPNKQTLTTQTGSLIFFDAFPTTPPRLGIDVMTPHMGGWYAEGQTVENTASDAEKLPADWHDPVPVKFLVVKQTSFQFCIAPRNKRCAKVVKMGDVMEALKKALEWMGAGAKTAAGYGCFEEDKKIRNEMNDKRAKQIEVKIGKAEDEEMRKKLSPLGYQFYQQEKQHNWEHNKDAFWQQGIVEKWLEKEPDSDVITRLVSLMDQHFKGVMDNPDAINTNSKKPTPLYKNRVKNIAKQLIKLREQ